MLYIKIDIIRVNFMCKGFFIMAPNVPFMVCKHISTACAAKQHIEVSISGKQ